jgi:dihydroorotase
MPVHTMVRGRFVVQNGRLLEETLGWGQNIKDVQTMPQPHPQNTEHYSSAMVKTQ